MPARFEALSGVVSASKGVTVPIRESASNDEMKSVTRLVCQFAVWTMSTSGVVNDVADADFSSAIADIKHKETTVSNIHLIDPGERLCG